MGGQPVGIRIVEYMKSGPNVPIHRSEIVRDVEGLDSKQVRASMRRLADQGMVEIITPGSVWKLTAAARASFLGEDDINRATVDSAARRAREEGAAARQALRERTYEHVDNFEGGAILLRSEAGKFFRAELTEL